MDIRIKMTLELTKSNIKIRTQNKIVSHYTYTHEHKIGNNIN